jgi:DNA-binding IclR family transcriptional regulator
VGSSPQPRRKVPTLREPRYSQSVECGLAILGSFTGEHPIRGIADLADEVGLSRSTVHRYVITFTALGFLEQGASRKYRLAPQVIDLGMSALQGTGFRDAEVRARLEGLQRQTSYTAVLAVRDGLDVVCVDHARSYRKSDSQLWLNVRPGRRLPIHCTAMGKVFLAFDTEVAKAINEIELVRHTGKTIKSRSALTKVIRDARESHFAVAGEEYLDGLIEIAVPVLSKDGECLGALALITGGTGASLDSLAAFCPALAEAADNLSARRDAE